MTPEIRGGIYLNSPPPRPPGTPSSEASVAPSVELSAEGWGVWCLCGGACGGVGR